MQQIFFMKECKLCGKTIKKYYSWSNSDYIEERRFVTDADNRSKAICTHCGYTIGITNKELKEIEDGKRN